MTPSLIRLASLVLASGLAAILLHLSLALADGWASRAAAGKGAVMALLGMGVSLPSALVFNALAHGVDSTLLAAATKAFLGAAMSEEGGRLLALFLLARMMMTRDPREYFIAVVAAGLSFGLVENLLYLKAANSPLVLGAVRGTLTAPTHLCYALLSGLGVWRFSRESASFGFVGAMAGLAFLMHGAFDFAIMAWPTPEHWSSSGLSTATLVGVGALLVIVVLAQCLGALAIIDAFLWRIEIGKPHDPALAVRKPLSNIWNGFGLAMIAGGGLAVVAIELAAGIAPTKAVIFAPTSFALAVSLVVWGIGVRRLAARQRGARGNLQRAAGMPGRGAMQSDRRSSEAYASL